MRRAPVLVALFTLPLVADAAPIPRVAAELAPHVAEAHPGALINGDWMPAALRTELVRWQRTVRDAWHGMTARLLQLADEAGVRVPDIRVLTTDPVATIKTGESSGFGWRDDPIRHRPKFHSGTDFRDKRGTPILAAGDGVVIHAARLGGYGNLVRVDHGGGVTTGYAHLSRFHVKVGDAVLAGQHIAAMGSTGRTTGSHLHFEVRLEGRPVDPVMAMAIARLGREAPLAGRLASFALTPELQMDRESLRDPPRSRGKRKPTPATDRPDRPGRVRVAKPLS